MKERASAPVLRRGVASALGKRQDRGPVMVDVGVDLHRKRSHVVALDPAGAVVLSRRIGNAPTESCASSASSSPDRSRSPSRRPTGGAGYGSTMRKVNGVAVCAFRFRWTTNPVPG
jgi:hypothetical protein